MELVVELNRGCQLNCIHCSSIKSNGMLSLEDIENTLKKVKVKEIILSGGEPTVHPNFQEIVEKLTRRYIVSLYTNGMTRLSDDLILRFHRIYVSLYGWEEFHNSITQSRSFGQTLFSLINAGIQKRFHRHKTREVLINSPVFGKKTKEIIHIARIREFPIHLTRLLAHGRAREMKVLSREKQLKIARKIKEEYPDTIISQSLLHTKCNWEKKLTLLPNKQLIHCVAGKLHPNPNQAYVCDKIIEKVK